MLSSKSSNYTSRAYQIPKLQKELLASSKELRLSLYSLIEFMCSPMYSCCEYTKKLSSKQISSREMKNLLKNKKALEK